MCLEQSPISAFIAGGGGGGSVSSGVLQIDGGVNLDSTLRFVTDQSSNLSPLKLSTTDASFVNSTGLSAVKYLASDNQTGGYWLNNEASFWYNGGRNILSSSSAGSLSVLSSGGAAEYLRISNSNGFSQFSGNVSLGLSYGGSPLGKLHIVGDTAANALYVRNNAGTAINSINSNGVLTTTITGNPSLTKIKGIELVNPDVATLGNARYSPSLLLQGYGWKTSAPAAAQTAAIEMYVSPEQYTSSTIPILVFEQIVNGVPNAQPILTIGGSNGITYNPSIPGMNPLITMGSVSLSFGGNAFTATTGGATTFNNWAFILNAASVWTPTSGDRGGFNVNIGFTPTSGNANYSAFQYGATINQTGTASGVTRGVNINPTLTRVLDFRAYSSNFTFNAPTTSATFRGIDLNYTINNTSSASTAISNGIFLNATETALNGMTHKLMSLNTSVNGEVYKISRLGSVTQLGTLSFGGETASFPMLKNSSAELFVRLADDTGYAGFACGIGADPTLYVTQISSQPAIGFFNSTPINKITTAVADAPFVAGGGGGTSIKTDDTIGGYTMGQVVQALINYGLLT